MMKAWKLLGMLVLLTAALAAAEGPPEHTVFQHANGRTAQQQSCRRDGDGRRVLHGTLTEWDESGVKRFEEHWVDGQRHGASGSWYADGVLRHEGAYANGRQDGAWTWYYPGGERRREEHWTAGKLDGRVTEWFVDGVKSVEQAWKDGRPHGALMSWYADGVLEYETHWSDGGEHGLFAFYNRSGIKERGEEWSEDGQVVRTRFHADGTIAAQSAYRGFLPSGQENKLWEIHYDSGEPQWKQRFRDGRPYPYGGLVKKFLSEEPFVDRLWGHHLRISNVTTRPHSDTTALTQFDIAWNNSWRNGTNHDAAWVFFKARAQGEQEWRHVMLEGTGKNPRGYGTGRGTDIEIFVPGDRVGLFVRRARTGQGAVETQGVTVVLDTASSDGPDPASMELRAFGIEMVYVAEGPFVLGSGGEEAHSFTDGAWDGGPTIPYRVTSEDAIPVGPEPGRLWATDVVLLRGRRGRYPDEPGVLPAEYPKGYGAFYCMKYLVTQGQYADFLNTLTRAQQEARTAALEPGGPAMHTSMRPAAGEQLRHLMLLSPPEIPEAPQPVVFICEARDLPVEGSWMDLLAFADWAGLRPMTELEYEKACRGPADPVPGEYAWGSAEVENIYQEWLHGEFGSGTEWYEVGNVLFGGTSGLPGTGGPNWPVRVGIFARPGRGRQGSGASYWRIMELTGNVYESTVTAANAHGRAFTGLHGNGRLTDAGDADRPHWPGLATRGGWGMRGGNWSKPTAQVSDRTYAAFVRGGGGRCVRTAPPGTTP